MEVGRLWDAVSLFERSKVFSRVGVEGHEAASDQECVRIPFTPEWRNYSPHPPGSRFSQNKTQQLFGPLSPAPPGVFMIQISQSHLKVSGVSRQMLNLTTGMTVALPGLPSRIRNLPEFPSARLVSVEPTSLLRRHARMIGPESLRVSTRGVQLCLK